MPKCAVPECTLEMSQFDIYCEDHGYITMDKVVYSTYSEVWN
jgi:hypothetical protein